MFSGGYALSGELRHLESTSCRQLLGVYVSAGLSNGGFECHRSLRYHSLLSCNGFFVCAWYELLQSFESEKLSSSRTYKGKIEKGKLLYPISRVYVIRF